MRPHGVKGLLIGVFGDEDDSDEEVPLEKLEQTTRVLETVPKGVLEEV